MYTMYSVRIHVYNGMGRCGSLSSFRDLGVFIGEMDSDGFAAKSGELQLFDRILACNGEDFTGETNRRYATVNTSTCTFSTTFS